MVDDLPPSQYIMMPLPPHSTYYNYTYEQENHQTNDDVLDYVLTLAVRLNCDIEMLRNLKVLYEQYVATT